MVRKTDEERLKELEEKMEQIKAQRIQLESRVKEKERKTRTKRLIEVGAEFEKYFWKGLTKEEAEKLAMSLQNYVRKNKDKILAMSKEQIEQNNNRREGTTK